MALLGFAVREKRHAFTVTVRKQRVAVDIDDFDLEGALQALQPGQHDVAEVAVLAAIESKPRRQLSHSRSRP